MKKVHNFNAGPCVLPQQAVDAAVEALKDFKGTGMPVICVSHRSKEWEAVMNECRALWKELLNIPDTHEVVFLGGGASMGFLYVAMNFLENKAGYLETGVWAKKALKEAKADVEYIEFPGCGHESWNPAFCMPDFMKWIFSKRRR